jgi:hypothetical protein
MLNSWNLIETRNRNIAAGAFSLIAALLLLEVLFRGHPDLFIQVMGLVVIVGGAINVVICWRRAAKADSTLLNPATVEDRLDELERLKRRDMVTPEEYAAKRQDILKDL